MPASVQHGSALARIVGQGASGRSLHGFQSAAALRVLARSLPAAPVGDPGLLRSAAMARFLAGAMREGG